MHKGSFNFPRLYIHSASVETTFIHYMPTKEIHFCEEILAILHDERAHVKTDISEIEEKEPKYQQAES